MSGAPWGLGVIVGLQATTEASLCLSRAERPGGREAAPPPPPGRWRLLPYKVPSLLLQLLTEPGGRGSGGEGWGLLLELHPAHPPKGTRGALSGSSRAQGSPLACQSKSTNRQARLRTQARPENQDPWIPTLPSPPWERVVHLPLTCTIAP